MCMNNECTVYSMCVIDIGRVGQFSNVDVSDRFHEYDTSGNR